MNKPATQQTRETLEKPEPVDAARDNQENELEAEQESAAAMDADVPQPPDASETMEGKST